MFAACRSESDGRERTPDRGGQRTPAYHRKSLDASAFTLGTGRRRAELSYPSRPDTLRDGD